MRRVNPINEPDRGREPASDGRSPLDEGNDPPNDELEDYEWTAGAHEVALHYTLRNILVMDQLTDVLTAISHPSRRAIIGQLATGPARFTDIAKSFDTALNSVTKHLKLLERAGLIKRKKEGREVLISFQAEPLREVAKWVHEYDRFWNEQLDQFEQHFKDKKKKETK